MILVRSGMFVYIMRATRYPGVYKIGISNDPKWRSWWISQTIPGDAVVIFKMELYFAYGIEQFLHMIFKPLNVKMKGSGKTEWFRPGLPLWIWMVSAAALLYWQPQLVFHENALWYAGGILFAAVVLPGMIFIFFVALFLLCARIIQECFVACIIFILFKYLWVEISQPSRATTRAKVGLVENNLKNIWSLNME